MDNPWQNPAEYLETWAPEKADLLFLAGKDWANVPSDLPPEIPILNLIQHPRHSWPQSPLRQYLKRKAIRICVSEFVTACLNATGEVNGPTITLPNGVDNFPEQLSSPKTTEILIVALKQPNLGKLLYQNLLKHFPDKQPKLLLKALPRFDFLRAMRSAKITVFLPHPQEGFYLPALEGMALDTLVICPNCHGNLSYCQPNTALIPPAYTLEELLQTISQALALPESKIQAQLKNARLMAKQHNLLQEHTAFYEILSQLNTLWLTGA